MTGRAFRQMERARAGWDCASWTIGHGSLEQRLRSRAGPAAARNLPAFFHQPSPRPVKIVMKKWPANLRFPFERRRERLDATVLRGAVRSPSWACRSRPTFYGLMLGLLLVGSAIGYA